MAYPNSYNESIQIANRVTLEWIVFLFQKGIGQSEFSLCVVLLILELLTLKL